jgi:hypothetical protein
VTNSGTHQHLRDSPTPPGAYHVATTLTTALAAALNMLIVLVLVVVVGPKMDAAGRAASASESASLRNRELIEESRRS